MPNIDTQPEEKPCTKFVAEVIAIGDEITSGQRLDTNSQWISRQLEELGVTVAYHSSVGDNLAQMQTVFAAATERADIVVCTGGIGPTADDLTREVIAKTAGVELEFNESVVEHIRSIFQGHGREMPESNNRQAYFPATSVVVENPEGTAPGIELFLPKRSSTVFALPGVPYELKQMWPHVESAINQLTGRTLTTLHHVIHTFGGGESQVEQMLGGLTERDQVPRVGITASHATISLRITAMAESEAACIEQMQPTIKTIQETLGDMVFGENGAELQDVVFDLLREKSQTISLVDFGFGGLAYQPMAAFDAKGKFVQAGISMGRQQMASWVSDQTLPTSDLIKLGAIKIRERFGTDIGVAVGPPEKTVEAVGDSEPKARIYELAIATDETTQIQTLKYGGHSKLRAAKTAKQILNAIRLHLLNS